MQIINASPLFQIFECQNKDCNLRFPSNLTLENFEHCPLCGFPVTAIGEPFSNSKNLTADSSGSKRIIHLLLDNLRSTFNVGSIFRTANCAAIDHVYCCGTTPTPDHPKFIKSGLNSEHNVSWSYHRNAMKVISDLKANEFSINSLEVTTSSSSLFSIHEGTIPPDQMLLLVGNEISGIDPGILDLSDSIVYIPMLGTKTSLNVSIAASIAIYVYRFSLVINSSRSI